jgi:hypothetical protein
VPDGADGRGDLNVSPNRILTAGTTPRNRGVHDKGGA